MPVQKKLLPRLRQRSHSLFMPKTEFTELIQTELNVVAPRSVLDNVVQFLHRVGQVSHLIRNHMPMPCTVLYCIVFLGFMS